MDMTMIKAIKKGSEVEISGIYESKIDQLYLLQEIIESMSKRLDVDVKFILDVMEAGHKVFKEFDRECVEHTSIDAAMAIARELEHKIEATLREKK
mgnify:CR=1 FL=1